MNKTVVQENLTIPFSAIEQDLGFNSRTIYNNMEELAESIKIDGLITPLTVMKNGDNFKLIAGYRRYRALEINKTKPDAQIKVNVVAYDSDKDIYLANLLENTARDEMHPLDLGRRLAELEAGTYRPILAPLADGEEVTVGQKISRKELAKRTSFNESHVGNLIRVHQKLPDAIKKAWKKNEIPFNKALKWVGKEYKTEDDQLEAFGEWKTAQEEEKANGKPKRRPNGAAAAEAEAAESEGSDEGESEQGPQGVSKSEIKSQLAGLDEKIKEGTLKGDELLIAKTKQKTLKWVLGILVRL